MNTILRIENKNETYAYMYILRNSRFEICNLLARYIPSITFCNSFIGEGKFFLQIILQNIMPHKPKENREKGKASNIL